MNNLFSKVTKVQEILLQVDAETDTDNHNNRNLVTSPEGFAGNIPVGLWTPINSSYVLQHLNGAEQKKAIDFLLKMGYQEYYYVMNNFEDTTAVKTTDELLDNANKTNLKIIIILLPPSEGGINTSYNWKGWIKYFNSLEKKYPKSFEGFTIDDFNWISTRSNTKFKNNVDFMEDTELSAELKHKSENVKFYPTVYFEGTKTGLVVNKYKNFIDGLVVASGCYYNVSTLDKQLQIFSEIFNKPIRYVVYPTITYNYSKLDYEPPTDRLIKATLSIASYSSDGLVIWRDADNPVIQQHLENRHDKDYLSDISSSKESQIDDENIHPKSKSTVTKDNHNTCSSWTKKYNDAYDKWTKLPEGRDSNDWERKILN
ncbi:MAG TPA: hypothetical protein VE594_00260 [Nitrososphaeraceae archaeon]|nr:hypothetical protein [Nitrososphaeraceae archaeon]